MGAMTTAAEAEAAIAQLSDLIAKLRFVVEEETALVHAGKVRNAATLGAVKSELAARLLMSWPASVSVKRLPVTVSEAR